MAGLGKAREAFLQRAAVVVTFECGCMYEILRGGHELVQPCLVHQEPEEHEQPATK